MYENGRHRFAIVEHSRPTAYSIGPDDGVPEATTELHRVHQWRPIDDHHQHGAHALPENRHHAMHQRDDSAEQDQQYDVYMDVGGVCSAMRITGNGVKGKYICVWHCIIHNHINAVRRLLENGY